MEGEDETMKLHSPRSQTIPRKFAELPPSPFPPDPKRDLSEFKRPAR